MKFNLQRDEEAVSAAVATVLLFGGVLSIIGLMMISMMPVIEEMEGSVERHDMASQMTLLAHETAELSERGMPGDSTHSTLIPVDGNLVWDSLRGGMWYSATWEEAMSLRARGALDFDDTLEIRHPESLVSSVCITDLRLGPDRPYYYTLDPAFDAATVTVTPGLAMPLGPIALTLTENGTEVSTTQLRVDEMVTLNLSALGETVLASSHPLNVIGLRGDSGATYMLPNDPEPADKRGQAWSIPLQPGPTTLHIISDVANQIHLTINGETSIHYAYSSNLSRTAVTSTLEVNLSQAAVAHITASTPSRMLVIAGSGDEAGLTAWPSDTGAYLGQRFQPPNVNGLLRLSNPGEQIITITWRGGGISVQPGGIEDVRWPPSGVEGSPTLDGDGAFFVTWSVGHESNLTDAVNGHMWIAADDTGALSGGAYTYHNSNNTTAEHLRLQLAGYTSSWNASGAANQTGTFLDANNDATLSLNSGLTTVTVEQDHPIRIMRLSGEDGMQHLGHDGAQRCTQVNTQASGWITTDLPWERMGGRGEVDIKEAWIEGRHPASLSIDVLGDNGESDHATIGTVWAFHLSRLSYQFSSSVDGMEVAYSGGAVLTNHPEFRPYVVTPPSDRGGPGPRFAATIPSMHPTADSMTGAGELELDIELMQRTSLASTPAYEVRRGWAEPYGTAIADEAGIGLEASEDWTVYPGRLDLLTDYVGWVPDPSYGTSEAVWHTNGEVIEFTLQMASLDVHSREVLV